LSYAELLDDPQLRHRGHFKPIRHQHYGELLFEHSGLIFSDSPRKMTRPGPHLGQHTEAVLGEVLGLSADEIARLRTAEVLR
jgi:benzylsuccinate CoA-transferase BbsF subunit